jgi:hypothetical protein
VKPNSLALNPEEKIHMDNTLVVRIVAGVLFAIVLGILVQRRRTRVN